MQATKHSRISQLWRSPSSVFAMGFIVLTLLTALFAYQLAPDASANGNRMIVELGAKRPGFSKNLLLVPTRNVQSPESSSWWNGTPDTFQYIPINSCSLNGDAVRVAHFIDEGLSDTLTFSLQQLVPAAIAAQPAQEQQEFFVKHRLRDQTFYLGTDRYGRDILSRLLIGSRVSIAVGLIAVLLSLSIGILFGSLAGYFGGWVDRSVMFLVNILWSVPTLLLVFALTLTLGKGFWEIFIAIGLTMWLGAARLIRGQTLALREADYVQAAKAIGASHARIIMRHILPHLGGVVMVIAASNFATAILVEAGLSFLGIGIQPPQPSWGLMIKEHYNFLITNQPLAAIIPGLAIMMLVYSFNILGNKLRDILDVRS
ncbi:MAG: ABC transporter permease [Chitinophagaceae bacterium]